MAHQADKSTRGDYGKVREAIADLLDAPNYDDGSYGPLLVRAVAAGSGACHMQHV